VCKWGLLHHAACQFCRTTRFCDRTTAVHFLCEWHHNHSPSSGTLSLFADDLLLYHPIRSAADYLHLQADGEKLCVWSHSNHLKFKGTKSKYMVISRKRHPTQPVQPLMVNNTTLERVYSYKYLGIWLTSTLNWSTLSWR